jgi:ribonuclease BN (tRNA processing enzyme)
MKVKIWGTRGSCPVSSKESVKYGGNTTCCEVLSECLPLGTKFFLDAGTGFLQASFKYLSEIRNNLKYVFGFSHFHWDHIMGLTVAPSTYIDSIPITMYGPKGNNGGPKEMIQNLFDNKDTFPVNSGHFSHKIDFKSLDNFEVSIIAVHPQGGFLIMPLDEYKAMRNNQVVIKDVHYDINECLVISMVKVNHGNSICISYRLEEKPTGKVLVFCTDNEDSIGLSQSMRNHFNGADLLLMDAQYSDKRYKTQTAGFGHGTPVGAVRSAVMCGVKKLGLTHHDPTSTDRFLKEVILAEAHTTLKVLRESGQKKFFEDYGIKAEKIFLTKKDVFICADYQEIEV